ncbi:(2Fe-2S)-binding protein [Labedella phragmitis]|uniref:(2Fe-2S)-binding protein n=1 Tax=Labedella phragmitis TaxID=2498849 RepID=A0A444PYU1_9MICO|nr:(2Fe-2S)-binding protein [Labedella phragmitis]RWZ52971.1 (2Fe-2S)-binding protein [Labedella phragmitis]
MSARRIPASQDPVRPRPSAEITVTLDGERYGGLEGQTLAGVLLGSGRLSWRTTSVAGSPRGVFCGIGVCFDCIAEVNGERDVRLCQRRAADGDELRTQHDALPVPVEDEDPPTATSDGAGS